MLQERNTTGRDQNEFNAKAKLELESRLDKQLRKLQNTLVQLEDIEMQRLFNGLVASMLTHPQSEIPGVAKEIQISDVKVIENDSDLSQREKQMIGELSEKLSYLKDLIGDKE